MDNDVDKMVKVVSEQNGMLGNGLTLREYAERCLRDIKDDLLVFSQCEYSLLDEQLEHIVKTMMQIVEQK